MLVLMKHNASQEQVSEVVGAIQAMGYDARSMPGGQRTAVGLIGNDGRADADRLQGLPGVSDPVQKEVLPGS